MHMEDPAPDKPDKDEPISSESEKAPTGPLIERIRRSHKARAIVRGCLLNGGSATHIATLLSEHCSDETGAVTQGAVKTVLQKLGGVSRKLAREEFKPNGKSISQREEEAAFESAAETYVRTEHPGRYWSHNPLYALTVASM